MLYRIYTEDKCNLASIVKKYFDSSTLIKATGYWQGQSEASTIIDIKTDDDFTETVIWNPVYLLAEEIKRVNKQQAVMVLRIALHGDWLV